MRSVRAIAALLIWPLAACYQYQSSDVARLQPGQMVRVTLTPSASASLAQSIGARASLLDGRVVARSDRDVTLALTQITRTAGEEQFLRDEPLSMPLGNAESWRVRSVDTPRTLLAVGSVVAVFAAGRVFLDQASLFGGRAAVSQGSK